MTFTRDELIELLLKNAPGGENEPNTITTREVRKATGFGQEKAKRTLDAARELGLVEPAMVYRMNDWGVGARVKGWRLMEIPAQK